MRALAPLIRLLQRSLRAILLRRLIAWVACAVILVVLGSALSHFLGNGRVIRLGLYMTALSFLPVFLLWPPPEPRLMDRLRRLDEEMVFEAYLEAEPGPVRDILRQLAAEKASALPFAEPPREPLLAGLGGLCGAAIACLVLAEAASFLVLGHSLTLSPGRPAVTDTGVRIDEQGFSDFATEDPAARRSRRERASEREEKEGRRGENPVLGMPEGSSASSRRSPDAGEGTAPANGTPTKDSIAKRKQGELEGEGTFGGESSSSSSPGGVPGSRKPAESEGSQASARMVPSENQGPEWSGTPPIPGRTGQGYEHTADTKVPSPLLDYRSRFESRYAERTGKHIAASGRMGFGDLRDFQRRYFDSFTLRADVGTAEDPYVTLLKRRWTERKGGPW